MKALFNPGEAGRLRAAERGLDVFEAGEGLVEEDEEMDILAAHGAGGEVAVDGDDDWASESEGWKRSGAGMSDEEDW